MGTRGLTCVVHNGEYKVAQYGQWDHYPEGQGNTALAFTRKLVRYPNKWLTQFINVLNSARFITADEVDDILLEKSGYDRRTLEKLDKERELVPYWDNEKKKAVWTEYQRIQDIVAESFKKELPLLTRDHGAAVLELILNHEGPVNLQNSLAFAANSLFCEYAYVIDLDKKQFEVYRGFNKDELDSSDRFYGAIPEDDFDKHAIKGGYHPITLWKSYSFKKLPTKRQFLRDMAKLQKKENDDYYAEANKDTANAA